MLLALADIGVGSIPNAIPPELNVTPPVIENPGTLIL